MKFTTFTFICLGNIFTFVDTGQCPVVHEEGRNPCEGDSKEACEANNCCWDDQASQENLKCFHRGCKHGYFGWGCQFPCHCENGGSCDSVTGVCDTTCQANSWGVGCLLERDCTYNDRKGTAYMGLVTVTEQGDSCASWSQQRAYSADGFPEKDITLAGSYCRNPYPHDQRPWCYYTLAGSSRRQWGDCQLRQCECLLGRYGVNCEGECHCLDREEQCEEATGSCPVSGCHPRWTGDNCQECVQGRFGTFCENVCHCHDDQLCDATTGQCPDGCASSWQGPDCQQECQDGQFGRDCSQECNCLDEEEVCDKSTGHCSSGCLKGFAGEDCSIEVPTMTTAPVLDTRDQAWVSIHWQAWQNPPDIGDGPVTSYLVYFRPRQPEQQEFGWNTQHVPPGETTARIEDLSRGQMYHIRVLPVHETGIVGFASPALNTSTCGNPLSGPDDVRVVEVPWSQLPQGPSSSATTPDSTPESCLSFTWKLPSKVVWGCDSIVRYRVYKLDRGETLLSETTDLNFSLCNPSPYRNMTLGVSMVNNVGLESEIHTDSFIGRSGTVHSLKPSLVSATSLRISWEHPIQPNGDILVYILRYKALRIGNCPPEESEQWSPRIDINSSHTWTEITDLEPYSSYQVKIWAETMAGKGDTASVRARTQAAAPSAEIQNFKVSSIQADQAFFSWDPIPCSSQNGEYAGYQFRLRNIYRDIMEQGNSVGNFTEMWLSELVPHTRYEISLSFANNRYGGPTSKVTFTTLESTPSGVKGILCTESSSEHVTVLWEPPGLPNGVVTRYDVKFYTSSSEEVTVVELPPTPPLTYTLRNLTAETTYFIRLRAYTKMGGGPWSEPVVSVTDVDVPSQPLGFTNTSRSSTTITFTWQPPNQIKGILVDYKVSCYASVGLAITNPVNKHRPPTVTSILIDGLKPGTKYTCDVQARTEKGYGPGLMKVFWTKPELWVKPSVPLLVETKQPTDNTVEVIIEPVQLDMEVEEQMYQVVVEHLKVSLYGGRQRRAAPSPCNLSIDQLQDYETAKLLSYNCYITAQFPDITEATHFQVGDNKTYNGFYNAPLEKGEEYHVWYGLRVRVDGETAASFSKTKVSIVSGYRDAGKTQQTSNASVLAGAGIGAAIAIVLIGVAVYLFVFRRRKLSGRDLLAFEVTESETLRSSPRCVINTDKMRQEVETSETEPLYSNSDVPKKARPPIPVDHLWNYVREKKQSATDNLATEYEELPQGLTAKCEVARRMENKLKNRYGNIVAYDHSRVKLDMLPTELGSDYINANFIDAYRKPNAFIATQGPSKATMSDIWRLAWERGSHRIIMVTNLVEDGRHKCEQYWPDSDQKQYGHFTVTMLDSEQFADYTIRTFTLTQGSESKPLRQFHFTAWPDHGVPTYATSLLAFLRKVRSFDDPRAGPSIIHCSAGVGRTGTYIALDYLLEQAKIEQQVDVYHCVQNMRTKRVNMVQTMEQYVFVYEALIEALKSGDTSIPCVDFRKRYFDLLKVNPDTAKVKLEEEYELLTTMSPPSQSAGCREATSEENESKNRYTDIVPLDNTVRPYLMTYVPGSTDYINAVFTDGYKQRDSFIATQTPLPNTVPDFWCMIHDHDVKTIVMLHALNLTDVTVGSYFPANTGSFVSGPFTVETVSTDQSEKDLVVRDFTLTYNKRGSSLEPRFIRQFHYQGWPEDSKVPPSRHSLIALLTLLEKWQQRSGNGPVVVHCMDGASRSGVFCSVSYMLERLKVEQEVDVFQSVKHSRINRPQFIPSVDHYRFVYDMAVEYMDAFETYANFK